MFCPVSFHTSLDVFTSLDLWTGCPEYGEQWRQLMTRRHSCWESRLSGGHYQRVTTGDAGPIQRPNQVCFPV